jgi:hypothetical protein
MYTEFAGCVGFHRQSGRKNLIWFRLLWQQERRRAFDVFRNGTLFQSADYGYYDIARAESKVLFGVFGEITHFCGK